MREWTASVRSTAGDAAPAVPKSTRWPSYAPIALVAILGILATGFLFGYVSGVERQHARNAFNDAARDRLWALRRETGYVLGSVRHIASFFGASQEVTRRQFREFVDPMLSRYPGTQALLWAPQIDAASRAALIHQARQSFPPFDIRSLARPGQVSADSVAAPARLFPILYVQPYTSNKDLLGADLGALPEILPALLRTATDRSPQVSAPFPSPMEARERAVMVIAAFIPVYDQTDADESTPRRSADQAPVQTQVAPRGFAGGIFSIQDIVATALSNLRPAGIDLSLYAGEATTDVEPVYVHRSRVSALADTAMRPSVPPALPLTFTDRLEVGDQIWTLVGMSVPGHFESDLSNSTLILGSGIAFTLLACIYLWSMIGKARQVRRLVAERTLELERSNAALNSEIKVRWQAEEALKLLNLTLEQEVAKRTAESERRARDLEQFAYVASHDLKAPLRGIANLATWLSQDLEDRLTPEIAEQLALMRDRVARMNALIEGLLTYSRIGRVPGAAEPIDLARLLAETIDSLAPPPGFKVEVTSDLPNLHGDPLALSMVLGNLIGNAIKHHDRSEGLVQVGVQCAGERCEFSVADDGPGIPPELHETVFLMFQTLKVKDLQGDTGIGLALVKKLVEEHGGRIQLHSGPGRGCRFVFTWPRHPASQDHT
ncbi:MAG: hypothetical protein EOM91_04295 [Sphingobacteriia bacterium]|nr:hypothetical protein [Sphingobacteriia bacterium]NCC39622.1 hypothetical protein [Gammaproteobacteria bacterium]